MDLGFFFLISIRNKDLNNCENIVITTSITTFSQNIYFQLWWVTVSYFIILFRPIRNWLLNNYEICCVSITIYMLTHINIYFLKSTNWWLKKKKNQWSDEQYILSKLKSMVAFTHSHNKCYNIFTKHLFSVVFGYILIFYYFISTYKKLTPQ